MACKRQGIMLATLLTKKLFDKLPKPVLVQPKIEGDRLRAKIDNYGEPTLFSSGAKIRTCVPHIQEELKEVCGLWRGIELDGEMYKHGMEHSEIRSIVGRTKNLHPDHKKIEYHIFDIVSTEAQNHRTATLQEFFKDRYFEYLRYVPSCQVCNWEDLQRYYAIFISEGYEGIIIRHPYAVYQRKKTRTLLKFKPRASESFRVLSVIEEKSKDGVLKGTFGAFCCETPEGRVFTVGSGPTKYQRTLIWGNKELFVGNEVKIRFQNYTKIRKVPKMQSIDKGWLKSVQQQLGSA